MLDLEINWALIAPIIVIQMALMIIAAVDCIRSERTNGPKPMWLLIIVLVNLIGPVLYFIIGRRND